MKIKKIGFAALIGAISISGLAGCNKNKTGMSSETEQAKIKKIESKKITEQEIVKQKKIAVEKAKIYANDYKLSEGKIYLMLTGTDEDNLAPEAAEAGLEAVKDTNWVENAKYQLDLIKKHNPNLDRDAIYNMLTAEKNLFFTDTEAREAMGEIEPLEKKDTKKEDAKEENTQNTEETEGGENEEENN